MNTVYQDSMILQTDITSMGSTRAPLGQVGLSHSYPFRSGKAEEPPVGPVQREGNVVADQIYEPAAEAA